MLPLLNDHGSYFSALLQGGTLNVIQKHHLSLQARNSN